MINDNKILEIFNSCAKQNLTFSKKIEDSYLTQRGICAEGKGLYDRNDKNAQYRYCLIINLNHKSNKCLYALLMNPSNTFPAKINKTENGQFDQTIRNLIILADSLNYSKIVVLNSYSYISANSKQANDFYSKKYFQTEQDIANRTFINKLFEQKNIEVLVACGSLVKNELYKNYVQIINNNKNIKIYTYASSLTNNRPRHLSRRSKINNANFLEIMKTKSLYELKITNIKNHLRFEYIK